VGARLCPPITTPAPSGQAESLGTPFARSGCSAGGTERPDVGTSGWQYHDWKGAFYPERVAQSRWLEHYATRFETVEVNATFYRLPERGVFASWAERTPPGFVMAVKLSRYLSHVRRLHDPAGQIDRFMRGPSRCRAPGGWDPPRPEPSSL
jgi:Protein of unknown function DUF72